MFVNALLAAVKLVAGVVGNSHALVADAVESMADIFASVVVWGALWFSARPADEDHPYGHDRAESLATMVVAWMLVAAAAGIAIESVREIVTPHHAPAAYTLVVLVVVIIVKELMFRVMDRAARSGGGGVINADAWHHRSDAITSLAAGVGIIWALVGGKGYEAADDWAALVAAAVIAWNGIRLMRPALDELMDRRDEQMCAFARAVAGQVSGVRGVEKVFARKAGRRYWLDMHIEVDPDLTVREAHEIAHAAKDRIRGEFAQVADVLVHIEPADTLASAYPDVVRAGS